MKLFRGSQAWFGACNLRLIDSHTEWEGLYWNVSVLHNHGNVRSAASNQSVVKPYTTLISHQLSIYF